MYKGWETNGILECESKEIRNKGKGKDDDDDGLDWDCVNESEISSGD